MPGNPRTKATLYVEVPPEMKAEYEALAARNGRRLTDEVLHALARHLAEPPVIRADTPPLSPVCIEPLPNGMEPPKKRGRKPKAPVPNPAPAKPVEPTAAKPTRKRKGES